MLVSYIQIVAYEMTHVWSRLVSIVGRIVTRIIDVTMVLALVLASASSKG